ncbi:helix-turn-helix domain-containing protein [Streptomyces daliensis]|uniref:Helix-turn-helix transcriptional regulator n=1 Tax=Streptomyces daliensis TaxID=299421 RepID=A0A8T4IV15_9ACTN|nr:helix-turn-helix transcriptional regulator [Streptomyces daliensis]
MTADSIGARIARLRDFRDQMTQERLAERADVSVDTIRKLEQGRRTGARIGTLRKIASALDVELERLLGQPTVTTTVDDDGGLLALRDAIQDVDALPGVLADDGLDEEPDAQAWMATVREARDLYWAGEYSTLAGRLPLILRDGARVTRSLTGASAASAETAWNRLALAYQLAASLATQAGHASWAFQAVEKQLHAAERASDPLMSGMGVSTLSWVLLRQGRWDQAQRVASQKANTLEPSFSKGTPSEYAVYGNLLIAAATPAARRNRHDEAQAYLNLAETAAVRSGPVQVYGTAFSRVDVQTQQVNVSIAGENADYGTALDVASRIDRSAISRPVHSAAHRVDVAHAQYETGDWDAALETLLDVERDQPEWIRYQTLAAATVGTMLEAERRRDTTLRGLAARLGVDPLI